MRRSRTMSPMTIVVVRDEPAGSSEAGPSVFAAGLATSTVTGGGADVVGAPVVAADALVVVVAVVAVVDVVAAFAMASAGGTAVCCEKAEDETKRVRRRTGIAERRFMAGETIGRTGMRQAARGF
jgi:uncharacterized membrane protein